MRKIITASAFGLTLTACSSQQIDSFYVENGSMAELVKIETIEQKQKNALSLTPKEREVIFTGHRIREGNDVILAVRYFSYTNFLHDSATYKKLTISVPPLPNSQKGEAINYNFSDISGFLSSSSSVFPGSNGCYGQPVGGNISVQRLPKEKILLTLNLNFSQSSPTDWKEECTSKAIREKFILQRKDVKNLTPWEGAPGAHAYEETTRSN
ncbi:hypothetical protein [Pseudomonas sp. PDM13]|uniref:hypothetical protein n=1 Tax=Pseudomonas sp. PDM13 TaxID=2769255 RepID=UPI0021DFFF17|nr:hypothetical protein [Pseudomonas sp. PDM13]MCU9951621.1 hypothetical protein [Pseudomonas sp. PDM13]